MWRRIAAGAILVAAALCVHAAASAQSTIDYQRSLLIMEPAVVSPYHAANACGLRPASDSWSFAALMDGISGGHAAALIASWLALYDSPQTVADGDVAQSRSGVRKYITDPWEKNNHALDKLPFRLLAILNRVDLRGSPLLSGENGGELRFVFGAVDVKSNCADLPFTVILEFGVREASCGTLRDWSKSWIDLSAIDPTTSYYVTQLKALTQTALTPIPVKPNNSPIDRIRTNEYLDNAAAEMREFELSPTGHGVVQDAVSLTPIDGLNGTPALANFLDGIADRIEGKDYWLPLFQPGTVNTPLLGAVALPHLVSAPPFWNAPGVDHRVATDFSGDTCSGCHSFSNANADFTHITALLSPAPRVDDGYDRASRFLIDDTKGSRCLALCLTSKANDCRPPDSALAMCHTDCGIPQGARLRRSLVH